MGRKFLSIILTVWVLLMMPMSVSALDTDRPGSVSVTLMDRSGNVPMEGAELSLYHVATVSLNHNHNLSYTFTDAFADCGCALDDPALSGKLDAFVAANPVSAQKAVTDSEGNAVFANLPLGLYFVKQTGAVAGYAPCTSFLVTVPSRNADGDVYDVNATPKTDVARLTDITVRKVWNTDASAQAADQVTVQLLRDGAVVKTAVLNEQNNWQVTYTDMPESDGYSIVEVDVPMGFTATYSQAGYVFTVTNTASLPQTGQLVWPILALSVTGLCLIAVGAKVLRKSGNRHG